jgi:hypothetical protein
MHEFIGGFSGMEWVPDTFNLVRKHSTTLPLFKFPTPKQRWTNNTRFASTFFNLFRPNSFVITLLFFQDSNNMIRWGGFENASHVQDEVYTDFFSTNISLAEDRELLLLLQYLTKVRIRRYAAMKEHRWS